MKKIALVAALPVALTLAACGEPVDETTPVEETVVTETMTPADDTMATDGMETPAADAMATETPAADAMATETPAGE